MFVVIYLMIIIFIAQITNQEKEKSANIDRNRAPYPKGDSQKSDLKQENREKEENIDKIQIVNFNYTRRLNKPIPDDALINDPKVKQKILDIMVQLIYVTRYKLQYIDEDKKRFKDSRAYRIAFVYGQIKDLWTTLMNVYSTAYWHDRWPLLTHTLLYEKCIKINVDMQYLLELMYKMHVELLDLKKDREERVQKKKKEKLKKELGKKN